MIGDAHRAPCMLFFFTLGRESELDGATRFLLFLHGSCLLDRTSEPGKKAGEGQWGVLWSTGAVTLITVTFAFVPVFLGAWGGADVWKVGALPCR